jgi:DNA-3-methyladenine glycosylase
MSLKKEFYRRDSLVVARDLLGKLLVHESPEGVTAGKIVETEAYKGPEDKAAHSFGNKRTPRTETMFGPKGHAYIYLIYGLYYCINVTSGAAEGKPEATLIRALEPIQGIDLMMKRRKQTGQLVNISSGPGRLCIAMGLTKIHNGLDMSQPPLYITEGQSVDLQDITQAPRIGVDYAAEHKDLPWRFYIKSNPYVSCKPKIKYSHK